MVVTSPFTCARVPRGPCGSAVPVLLPLNEPLVAQDDEEDHGYGPVEHPADRLEAGLGGPVTELLAGALLLGAVAHPLRAAQGAHALAHLPVATVGDTQGVVCVREVRVEPARLLVTRDRLVEGVPRQADVAQVGERPVTLRLECRGLLERLPRLGVVAGEGVGGALLIRNPGPDPAEGEGLQGGACPLGLCVVPLLGDPFEALDRAAD